MVVSSKLPNLKKSSQNKAKLSQNVNKNKVEYLQELNQKYGEFKIAIANKEGGWSKHLNILDLDPIKNEEDKKFMEKSNNRTMLKCEIRIDLDPIKGEEEVSKIRLQETLKKIKKYGLGRKKEDIKIFFSGSRGYHIHIIETDLMKEDTWTREKIREHILKKLNADEQLKSENHMLALEYSPHYKTGKNKEELKNEP